MKASESPSRSRKIFQVVRSAQVGGVETHVRYVLGHLKANGDDARLLSLSAAPADSAFQGLDVPILTLSDRSNWGWHTVRAGVDLWKTLRADKPDIVHVHGARPILIGTLAARLAGVRNVVCSLHGAHDLMAVRDDGSSTAAGRWFARFVHGVGFRLCSRIVVCAERLTRDARVSLASVTWHADTMLASKKRVVYHGIDVARFDGARDYAKGVQASKLVIGTLSRLDEPKKGIGVLLQAVAELERRGVPVTLRIAGDGYSRTPLERQAASLGLSDCSFLGFVDDPREFYASLDVFVLASLSEGMPLVNLEAMAAGTPVVTTNVGGAAEAVLDGVTGVVVPPSDSSALATALETLARERRLLAEYGKAGRDRAREFFSVEAMFRRLNSVYDELRINGEGLQS